jgi:AraC-like DNA-binding protein
LDNGFRLAAMRYKKFPPASELKNLVECYFIWEGDAAEKIDVQSPPNCFDAIVFNFADPTWAYQHTTEMSLVPEAFICGLFTSNYHRVLKGKIGMAGVVLKPTAVHNMFSTRMSTLVNSRMPLELMVGERATALRQSIIDAQDDEAKVVLLEKLIFDVSGEYKTRISIIDEVVEMIDQHKGSITVDELATRFGVSRRYLEKQFLVKVGVSPKFYARLKRFSDVSNRVAHSKTIDWQDVVDENGFHDRSHLTKEFLEFNKMNPSEYHQKHQEMTRFVKG